MESPPQNVRMPTFSSAGEATLSARYLMETLQKTTPKAPFATINVAHHTPLRSLKEIFNIIPKSLEQQSANKKNGRRQEMKV